MCFGALTDGDAREEPVARLLRAEAGPAVRQGMVAALAVLAVLLAGGVGIPLAAAASVAALVSTAAVHQAVLLAGIAVLRWRANSTGPTASRTA
jgi:hypothetical protein